MHTVFNFGFITHESISEGERGKIKEGVLMTKLTAVYVIILNHGLAALISAILIELSETH